MFSRDLITIVQTCGACPEAYDVYHNGDMIGDMRLRNSYFSARFGCDVVYDAYPKGDGIFECDEREKYLALALEAIYYEMNEEDNNKRSFKCLSQ
jgi:hypothetical protein